MICLETLFKIFFLFSGNRQQKTDNGKPLKTLFRVLPWLPVGIG